jgi:hypothetical protein
MGWMEFLMLALRPKMSLLFFSPVYSFSRLVFSCSVPEDDGQNARLGSGFLLEWVLVVCPGWFPVESG